MFLSIVSIFCDNDYKLIPELLINIEEKCKIRHEVILIDNRERFKDAPIDISTAKVFSKGYNAYQFEARRYAIQYCKGDYIWFIDSDDSLLDISEDLNFTEDLIVFNYAIKLKVIQLPYSWEFIKETFKRKRFTSITKEQAFELSKQFDIWALFCCTLWNKWIKRELVKNIANDLPENKIIVASEDTLLCSLAIDRSKSICFCDDTIYLYNQNTAKGSIKNMTTERFLHIIKGKKESRKIFKTLISDYRQYDNIKDQIPYFYIALAHTDNPNECFKEMRKHFTKTELKAGLSHAWIKESPQDIQNIIFSAYNFNYD